MQKFDVIIVGSGIVGLVCAQKIARHTSLTIGILEAANTIPTWTADKYHPRVSAISLASQKIFQDLQVWQDIKKARISPFCNMQVWDAIGGGEIHFSHQELGQAALGFIIENNLMQTSLLAQLANYPQIQFFPATKLQQIHKQAQQVECLTEEGQPFACKLLIGSDGANSFVKKYLGTQNNKVDYQQQAIVATVETQLPHNQTARQIFLSTGPLAFLPLANETLCSIVWSMSTELATTKMNLSDEVFLAELQLNFPYLGQIIVSDRRHAFPLTTSHVEKYIHDRIALIGDAAHTIHPLAGQGLNLGLQDAYCLAETVIQAWQQKRNVASYATLRKYERERRSQNAIMLKGVDTIQNLFASAQKPVQFLRSIGLDSVNKSQVLKKLFSQLSGSSSLNL